MPKGIYERNKEVEVLPEVSEPEVRKYSDEKDHKGHGHALCLNCKHRDDMHHTWKEYKVIRNEKDFLGNVRVVEEWMKDPIYNVPRRACQHACKCEEYK